MTDSQLWQSYNTSRPLVPEIPKLLRKTLSYGEHFALEVGVHFNTQEFPAGRCWGEILEVVKPGFMDDLQKECRKRDQEREKKKALLLEPEA